MEEITKLKKNRLVGNSSKENIKSYLKLTYYSFLLAFVLTYFIIVLQIFTPGISGIALGFSYTITELLNINSSNIEAYNTLFYWTIYIILNIPIMIFAFKNYGKEFVYKSLYVFVMVLFFSNFLTFVPGFSSVILFGTSDQVSQAELLIIAIIGGTIYGYSVGNIFKLGSSSMGLDPIVKYVSREKQRDIKGILFWFSIGNSIFFTILLEIISGSAITWNYFIAEIVFGRVIITSIAFMISYSVVTSFIYKTRTKISLKIISKRTDEISEFLNYINYHRGHTIEKSIGGYSKENKNSITMILNNEEIKDIIEIVKIIDDDAFIYANDVTMAQEKFAWNPITFNDKRTKYKNVDYSAYIVIKKQEKRDLEDKSIEDTEETEIN